MWISANILLEPPRPKKQYAWLCVAKYKDIGLLWYQGVPYLESCPPGPKGVMGQRVFDSDDDLDFE